MAKKRDHLQEKNKASRTGAPQKRRRPNYRDKQRSTSIYFLIWSIFTAMSVLIILLFGITQQVLMVQTYKSEASREITEKGKTLQRLVTEGPPEAFGGNYSGYLRYLSATHDVRLYLLSEEGQVLFPQEPNIDPNNPEIEKHYDFSDEMKRMLAQMTEQASDQVVYEGNQEYVYGAKLAFPGEADVYLYAAQSLELVTASVAKMGVRMMMISIFVLVLVFAVSSAVSGWLTKPITEMREKAQLLARGDFDVDFHGNDYGEEMVALADTLNYARDELSKTDNMQKELIANVSHDFRTPLTMIKAYASMIIEISGDVPEKRNKHAQVIVDESERLTSLVNDVLDISKLRSGIDVLQDDIFDMSAYVYEILDRFAYLKETQGYRFYTDVDKDLWTRADKLKIGQVLYNLIGNAVNYTGEDKKVYVSLKKETDGVFRFSVRDTGKGIKPEELSAVWDRYYRSSEMHKRPVKGMGLGLSIVKTVLEKHRFHFGVDSEVGKGSVFFVLLPLIETVEVIDEEETEE